MSPSLQSDVFDSPGVTAGASSQRRRARPELKALKIKNAGAAFGNTPSFK